MLSCIAVIALSQIPITGSSAFTRVPYNTSLGYSLANRQLPLGYYNFNPPGIANPKVITIPRREGYTGTVLKADVKNRLLSVRLDDGNIIEFSLTDNIKWKDEVGDFTLRLGKTRVNYDYSTITILR